MKTWIAPDDTWTLWAVMIGGTGTAIWLEQTYRWAARVSAPLLALGLAMILSNTGVMPKESPAYAVIGDYLVPIALSGVQELYLRKPISMIVGQPFLVAGQGMDRHADVDAAVEQITTRLKAVIPPYVEYQPKVKMWRHLTYLLDRTPPR